MSYYLCDRCGVKPSMNDMGGAIYCEACNKEFRAELKSGRAHRNRRVFPE